MKPRLILLLLAGHVGTALAQYKCTAADGAITFQQTPCFGAKAEEKLTVVPNGHPPAASGVPVASSAPRYSPPPPPPVPVKGKAQTDDERLLARLEREREHDRQHDALARELQLARDAQAQRAAQLQQDIAAAQVRYGDNPVDAPALRDAIAALNSRYTAMQQIDDDRVRSAQRALDEWDRTPR